MFDLPSVVSCMQVWLVYLWVHWFWTFKYIVCSFVHIIYYCMAHWSLWPLKDSNGTSDSYAAIAQVDQLRQEPESLRKWREEQKARLEELGDLLVPFFCHLKPFYCTLFFCIQKKNYPLPGMWNLCCLSLTFYKTCYIISLIISWGFHVVASICHLHSSVGLIRSCWPSLTLCIHLIAFRCSL